MEVSWDSLPPSDKAYYKSELHEYRDDYDKAREFYFELESGYERDKRELESDP